MSNINLDLKNIRDNIKNTTDMLRTFGDNTNKLLALFRNVDTAWNDDTTTSFIKTIDKDNESFNELISAIKNQISLTENFCDSIESSLANYLDVSTVYNVRCIESSTERSIELLSEISNRITNVKSTISTLAIPSTSSNRSAIFGLMSNVNTNEIGRLQEKIRKTVSAIDQAIEAASYDSRRVGRYEMDATTMKFVSSIQSPNLKRGEQIHETHVHAANAVSKVNVNDIKEEDIKTVSYRNHTERVEATDARKVDVDEVDAKAAISKGKFLDNEEKEINSNYGFLNKAGTVKTIDAEKQDVQEYGFNSKIGTSNLKDNKLLDIKADYTKTNTSSAINIKMPSKITINEYHGPSNNTQEVLFENGMKDIETNKYNYKDNRVSANISDTAGQNIREYGYVDHSTNANIADNTISVDGEYRYADKMEKTNLSGIDIKLSNKDYHVNDDNIIE